MQEWRSVIKTVPQQAGQLPVEDALDILWFADVDVFVRDCVELPHPGIRAPLWHELDIHAKVPGWQRLPEADHPGPTDGPSFSPARLGKRPANTERCDDDEKRCDDDAAEHDEILQRETSKFNDWLATKDGEIKEKNEAMDSLKVRNF